MKGDRKRKLALLIAAKPVGDIPRMINLAECLTKQGVDVLHLGRKRTTEKSNIRIGDHNRAFNISMWSAKIPFAFLRQPLILLEFLLRTRYLIARIRPDYVFTFYNTAAALHRFHYPHQMKKIAWLLDFRHPYFLTWWHRLQERIGESGWRHANALVVPTKERLALHLGRRPECMNTPAFVIHNAPNRQHHTPTRQTEHREHSSPLTIIYTGGVGPGYGLQQVITAVGDHERNVRLRIVGKKRFEPSTPNLPVSYQRDIHDAIKSVRHPERITWDDAVPYRELGKILQSAHVGYATYEGGANLNDRFSAPGKTYDYLSQSLVILADDQNPISELLKSFGCGITFPFPVTKEKLQDAISKLCDLTPLLPEMKDNADRLFNTELAHDIQVQPLLSWLGLISNTPQAPPISAYGHHSDLKNLT